MTAVFHPAFVDSLPDDVRQNAARHRAKIDWNAPFQPGEDLRVTEPVAEIRLPRKVRQHLAEMTPERREQLEREWLAAEAEVPSIKQPISAELQERARIEWENGHG